MGEKVKKFWGKILTVIKSVTKHPFVFGASVCMTVFWILQIFHEYDFDDTKYRYFFNDWALGFLTASLIALPLDFILTNSRKLIKYLIQSLSVVIVPVCVWLFYFILRDKNLTSYANMIYFGLILTVIVITVFLFAPKTECKAYYANLVKYFCFSGLLVLVGYFGAELLFLAFNYLLHEVADEWKWSESIFIIFFGGFYINIFTYYLFEKREEPSGKAFKIILLYILMPVYILLLVLLYSYLIKALFLWQLPNGQINWFVSLATAFYLVFYFILQEYEDLKIMKLFYKFSGLLFIPLILVQFPAFFIRVNAYGFTGWRYSSLLYNIFATSFIIVTFINKGKYTKFAIPVLGLFFIFASMTPFNLIDMAYNSQFKKMTYVLEKYNMIKDGKLTDYDKAEINKIIENEDRHILNSSFNYLKYTSEHKKPDFMEENGFDFKKVFGIERADDVIYQEHEYKLPEGKLIQISGYDYFEMKNIIFFGRNYSDESKNEYKIPIIPEGNFDISELLLLNQDEPVYHKIDDNHEIIIYEYSYKYNEELKKFLSYNVNYYYMKKN